MIRRARSLFALAVLLCLGSAVPAGAQEPELYQDARTALAAGDTVSALGSLRKLTEAEPGFAPGWGLLGRLLTARASGVATDFRERQEADKALRRALRLDPDHPLYLMALGQLMRKQQMPLDAKRVLNRAAKAMEKDPGRLPPEERAELYFQRGLFHEDVYLDTRHLMFVPDLPAQTPDCSGIGTFCLNFTRPKQFNEHFRRAADLSGDAEDDFEKMADAFRRTLDADPKHSGAFRRLAIHLVDRGEYAEAQRLARRFINAVPESPWGHLTLGLVYQRTGRDSLAEVEFDRGIERAPPNIAEHYRDVSPLLRESLAEEYSSANRRTRRVLEELLWRKSDPLYLTTENEVRVVHLARVAFADLMYEDPADGLWGAETEQGLIYVRYGPPNHIWKVPRDASRETSAAAFDVRSSSPRGGGRWIFWNYGWNLPNFIFEKQLRYRHASHLASSFSKAVEEEARETQPAVYSTSLEFSDYPAQIARFKGAADSIVEVDLYSEIPAELFGGPDSLDLGFFLFGGPDYQQVYKQTLRASSKASQRAVTYSLPLLADHYIFSLEANARTGKAAVRRGALDLKRFRDGHLALSDLVLADAVAPNSPKPKDRRGFAIRVNRRRDYEPGDPLALYWEVYGLSTDDEGFAHYQVNLRVTDAGGGSIFAKVAGALGKLVGLSDDQDTELSFERFVELTGDRVPEYLSLELANSDPGDYRVSIEVIDLLSEQRAAIEREFQVSAL